MQLHLILAPIAVLAFAFVFARWLWSRRKLYELSMKLPGPISLPFVGSVTAAIDMVAHGNAIEVQGKYAHSSTGLCRGWLGTQLLLYVTNPDDLEAIFNCSLSTKPRLIYDPWSRSMGKGLITMNGIGKDSPWKEHKKIINPSLGVNMNKTYFRVVQSRCFNLEERFGNLCNMGTVDIFRPVAEFLAETVTESMYGVKRNFSEIRNYDVVLAVETILKAYLKRFVNFWYLIEPLYKISALGRNQRRATAVLRKFCEDIFDERRSKVKMDNEADRENTVMDVLLRAHDDKQMTREEIVDEMMNLWPAAADTTGMSLTFALLSLAMHKQCQDRCFEEIKSFCEGDRSIEIEYGDLGRFQYVEACLKEALRMFASGPTTAKYASEDFELKSRGLTIPAGTILMFSSFLTHRDPRVWPEPNAFRPERFYDKASTDQQQQRPFAFCAFYGGPRKCPGRSYSMMVLTLAIVRLLMKYEFHSDWKIEDIPLSFDINVRSEWGYKAKITPRVWN